MKKFHMALSTAHLEQTVADYTQRLECDPVVLVPGHYALWRTAALNISVRQSSTQADSEKRGSLRHLGWEDATASHFSSDTDSNGIVWERFAFSDQCDEIRRLWPDAEIL